MNLDQTFVIVKPWIVAWFPDPLQPVISAVVSAAAIIGAFATLFAITTLLERKGLGRIQNRYGPNRVGPCGLFQPIVDGIKMLTKEDIVPRAAGRAVHFLAPIALLIPVFLSFSVLPYWRNMQPIDLHA